MAIAWCAAEPTCQRVTIGTRETIEGWSRCPWCGGPISAALVHLVEVEVEESD
jgi:hypothetical protein